VQYPFQLSSSRRLESEQTSKSQTRTNHAASENTCIVIRNHATNKSIATLQLIGGGTHPAHKDTIPPNPDPLTLVKRLLTPTETRSSPYSPLLGRDDTLIGSAIGCAWVCAAFVLLLPPVMALLLCEWTCEWRPPRESEPTSCLPVDYVG